MVNVEQWKHRQFSLDDSKMTSEKDDDSVDLIVTTVWSNDEKNEYNTKDDFEVRVSFDSNQQSLTVESSNTQDYSEISTMHSYCPFNNDSSLPPPYPYTDFTSTSTSKLSCFKQLSLKNNHKKLLLHRFDSKSTSFAPPKRRKFGKCYHNFSYFNLHSKSISNCVGHDTSSVCVCVNGKVQLLNEDSLKFLEIYSKLRVQSFNPYTYPSLKKILEDIVQIFPMLSLSKMNSDNDNSTNDLSSLSFWLSSQNRTTEKNYLKLFQTSSKTMKRFNMNVRFRKNGLQESSRTFSVRKGKKAYEILHNISICDPDEFVSRNEQVASATFHVFDTAESSITLREADASQPSTSYSSCNSMLNDFESLSLHAKSCANPIIVQKHAEQEEICKQLANLPLTDPKVIEPFFSPIPSTTVPFELTSNGDLGLSQQSTKTDIELSRLKL